MNRPARQRARLLEKIASKETRKPGKPGKRAKAWNCLLYTSDAADE